MYPFPRMIWQLWRHRNDPPLDLFDIHESRHLCLPWDLDIFAELNNGRTLTLLDLGRVPAARRTGLEGALRRRRWGMTMAGVHVRYRRRIRAMERITMRTRLVCWDHRFIYLEQAMFKESGEAANHALYRGAVTGPGGIVAPAEVLAEMGQAHATCTIPD